MAYDIGLGLGNALLDRYDTEFPAGSVLEIRSGAPAGTGNAAGGVLLCSIVTPAGPFAAAAAKIKDIAGVWQAAGLAAAGAAPGTDAGHFRFRNAADTRREEGTITATGGGGDAEIDSIKIITGKVVTVTLFRHRF